MRSFIPTAHQVTILSICARTIIEPIILIYPDIPQLLSCSSSLSPKQQSDFWDVAYARGLEGWTDIMLATTHHHREHVAMAFPGVPRRHEVLSSSFSGICKRGHQSLSRKRVGGVQISTGGIGWHKAWECMRHSSWKCKTQRNVQVELRQDVMTLRLRDSSVCSASDARLVTGVALGLEGFWLVCVTPSFLYVTSCFHFSVLSVSLSHSSTGPSVYLHMLIPTLYTCYFFLRVVPRL